MLAPPSVNHIAGALAACAALGVAGCGSSGKSSSSAASNTAATAPAATTPAAGAPATTPAAGAPATTPAAGASSAAPATDPRLAHKPKIAKPRGPAPSALRIKDLVTGRGPAAHAGQTLSVQYVGVLYRNGKQFDASWDRGQPGQGQPFSFALGAGQVIPGWDQGLLGMRVGGRRELMIPAALAYGSAGSPPAIGPNQPLVFVIDLLSAR